MPVGVLRRVSQDKFHFFGPLPLSGRTASDTAAAQQVAQAWEAGSLAPSDSPGATAAGRWKPWHAAALLFFLAPAMARLLSTALTPAEYFSPIVFLGLHASLGCAAVLLREFAVRQRLGSWGKLLLGIALGLFYEGLITRNLFAAEGGELGTLVGYGRSLEVNWLWGVLTLAFYATQGFLLPLLLSEMLLPRLRGSAALSKKGVIWISLLAGGSALIGFFGISANIGDPAQVYHPGLGQLLLCLAGVLGLPWLALVRARREEARLAGLQETEKSLEPESPNYEAAGQFELQSTGGTLRFVRRRDSGQVRPSPRALGWLCGLSFALLLYILPALYKDVLKIPAAAAMLLSLIGIAAAIWLARRLSGRLTMAHRFALLAGTQGCWIALCLLLPLDDGLRPDETIGMPVLGLLALSALVYGGYRLRQLEPAPVRRKAPAKGLPATCG